MNNAHYGNFSTQHFVLFAEEMEREKSFDAYIFLIKCFHILKFTAKFVHGEAKIYGKAYLM